MGMGIPDGDFFGDEDGVLETGTGMAIPAHARPVVIPTLEAPESTQASCCYRDENAIFSTLFTPSSRLSQKLKLGFILLPLLTLISNVAKRTKKVGIVGKYGYDVLLGSIAALYVFMAPYTKVEESFNVQAMHDILYWRHHIEKYDHLEFPGVVPRTFIGALFVSILASPFVLVASLLQLPMIYSLYAIRLVLGCIILSTLRFFRIQNWIKSIFGPQVEAFFVILTSIQFHLLFYCSRPLPNIYAFGLVLNSLIFATVIFRCDILLLVSPMGLQLLLSSSISLPKAILSCGTTALFCVGFTILVDSFPWRRLLWPELEVFWFNSVLNKSSEWGLGVLLDRRVMLYIIPVLSFVLLYSKLPHKELRFIISSLPMFNLSAAVAATRIYNNRKKGFWKYLYIAMLGLFVISLGCTIMTFMASYENYPSGYALKGLHNMAYLKNNSKEVWVHIDTFSAINGISRFCENDDPWRYSKEEGIPLQEFQSRNFTYLLSEHALINGYNCLYSIKGFSGTRLRPGLPPISLVKTPKDAKSAAVRIVRNLEKFGLYYAILIWTALFISLVPKRKVSVIFLVSTTEVAFLYFLLLRACPNSAILHRIIDKRLVFFVLFVITAVMMVLTHAVVHLFVVLAATTPVVLVHAALSKMEDVIVKQADRGEMAHLLQGKLGDDDSHRQSEDMSLVRKETQDETDRITGKTRQISTVPIHLSIYSPNGIFYVFQ
ncbi:dolichyl-P-Man:Man(7)GlcNAc(2)-PP-dolichol alpha-1,6-mannosyltransferase [Castilleja foliolosa]|uniref:Mannosyltransferase n=1 Tax=Castilleja foliolosa TaxID=1961234 RepID=A0ABD3DHP5_9LAMI